MNHLFVSLWKVLQKLTIVFCFNFIGYFLFCNLFALFKKHNMYRIISSITSKKLFLQILFLVHSLCALFVECQLDKPYLYFMCFNFLYFFSFYQIFWVISLPLFFFNLSILSSLGCLLLFNSFVEFILSVSKIFSSKNSSRFFFFSSLPCHFLWALAHQLMFPIRLEIQSPGIKLAVWPWPNYVIILSE